MAFVMKYTVCEGLNILMILKMQELVLRGNVENVCMTQHRTVLVLKILDSISNLAVGSFRDSSDLILLESRRV